MADLMTLEEVAEYLRLSLHTIYKMAQRGRIPAMKAGRQWRFDKNEIDKWMRDSAKQAQPKRKTRKKR